MPSSLTVPTPHLRQGHLCSIRRPLFRLLFLGRAILQKDLPGGGSTQPKKGLPKVKVTRVPAAHHRPVGAHPFSVAACGNTGFHLGKPPSLCLLCLAVKSEGGTSSVFLEVW